MDEELYNAVFEGDRDTRLFVCQDNLLLFGLYYFPEVFTYTMEDMHYELVQNLEDLVLGNEIDKLLEVLFRESTKTTWTKITVEWIICFQKFFFINWESKDKKNVEAALLDITVNLQENELLIRDFGQLYTEALSPYGTKKKKKITEFITSTGIKVQGYTTQMSARGRLYKQHRPGFIVFDDFEDKKAVRSAKELRQISDHMDELAAGVGATARTLYLANLISESGNVQKLIDQSRTNPRMRYHRVDVVEKGEVMWKSKYAKTDKEAMERNRNIEDKNAPIVSLEQKRRDLNVGGRKVYEVEMLNSPEAAGDVFFDRKRVKKDLARVEDLEPDNESAGMVFIDKYRPDGRYVVGSDSSEGIGRDANAACCLNLRPVPNRIVATYANNEIAPDTFAYELKRMSDYYGECYIAPELNNHGHATVSKLKTLVDVSLIHRNIRSEKVVGKPDVKYGVVTSGANKETMFYDFKAAYENGDLEIDSLPLLREMFIFSLNDLGMAASGDVTRHFDLLTAAVIAWSVRKQVPNKDIMKKALAYKQPPMENQSSNTLAEKATPLDPTEKYQQSFVRREEIPYNNYEQPEFDS